jgi:hypothetical protein
MIDGDRLVFTSKTSFSQDEATAWWLCFDALRTADHELRRTSAMLAKRRPALRLRTTGIKNAESPEALAENIKTDGWLPIDAHIQVTDVASLARGLGGEQLYGNDNTVPLRELIQNAADAVRARRIYDRKDDKWGTICVRTGKDERGAWIEVEDNGIGMSTEVLKGPFLDFGKSYWGSDLMLKEWPGLLARGFVPTGKFGVGFYSVFMWGDKVSVTTLRRGDAQCDALTLQFGAGLEHRPLLRRAHKNEYLEHGGTRIRVWLKDGLVDSEGRFPAERWDGPWELGRLCKWLCPSIDVDLDVEDGGKRKRVVTASDWITMDGTKLFLRLNQRSRNPDRYTQDRALRLRDQFKVLRLIKSKDGTILGRACLLHGLHSERKQPEYGVVTVGGMRASVLSDYRTAIVGVLAGRPTNATRQAAIPIAEPEALAKWATEQAKILRFDRRESGEDRIAQLIRSLGGDTGPLAIGYRQGRSITIDDLRGWKKIPDEIMVIDDDYQFREQRKAVSLAKNVIVIPTDGQSRGLLRELERFDSDAASGKWPTSEEIRVAPDRSLSKGTIYFAVLEALSIAWQCSTEDLIAASDFGQSERSVGKKGSRAFKAEADLLRRPRAVDDQ